MKIETVALQNIMLFFCVTFPIVLEISASHGKSKWIEKMKTCGDGEINVDEAFKGKEECKPAPNKEDEEKKASEGQTRQSARDVLDKTGDFNESGCTEYVNKVYPEEFRKNAVAKMKKCADKNSHSFSMDNKCAGYHKFRRCVYDVRIKVCKIKFSGKGKQKKLPPHLADEDGEDEE